MTEWAESKIVPGQFTGSTGANVMTGDVLNGPVNAWTRKVPKAIFKLKLELIQ